MERDPRRSLAVGTYRATVTQVGVDPQVPNLGLNRDVRYIHYTLPQCGDWVYRIDQDQANRAFIDTAAERGWFDFDVLAPTARVVID